MTKTGKTSYEVWCEWPEIIREATLPTRKQAEEAIRWLVIFDGPLVTASYTIREVHDGNP